MRRPTDSLESSTAGRTRKAASCAVRHTAQSTAKRTAKLIAQFTAAPLLLALSLAGCGDASTSRTAQVAARVNGSAISIRQIRTAGATGVMAEPDQHQVAKALERVIDQELLVQAAGVLNLEREPDVAEALENARRQILAQAFVEKAAGPASRNTPEEIHAFYEQHPSLFRHRRIYRFEEIAIAAPKDEAAVLKEEVANAADLQQVAASLRTRNLAFTMAMATRPAEQLPLGYLPQLASMRDGQIAVFTSASGVSVMQLVQSQDAALTEKQAAPVIDRFLQGRKRLQIAEEAVRRLREKATIEYSGEFGNRHADPSQKQRSIARITMPEARLTETDVAIAAPGSP
jgi:EpsD family peptidyl-prolyl cis-trans isomerase